MCHIVPITAPTLAFIGDGDPRALADTQGQAVTEIRSTSACPKCHKPMRFALGKSGNRKPMCLDCDGNDPLKSRKVAKLLNGELKPLEQGRPLSTASFYGPVGRRKPGAAGGKRAPGITIPVRSGGEERRR